MLLSQTSQPGLRLRLAPRHAFTGDSNMGKSKLTQRKEKKMPSETLELHLPEMKTHMHFRTKTGLKIMGYLSTEGDRWNSQKASSSPFLRGL